MRCRNELKVVTCVFSLKRHNGQGLDSTYNIYNMQCNNNPLEFGHTKCPSWIKLAFDIKRNVKRVRLNGKTGNEKTIEEDIAKLKKQKSSSQKENKKKQRQLRNVRLKVE
jgi:hypothetical protein